MLTGQYPIDMVQILVVNSDYEIRQLLHQELTALGEDVTIVDHSPNTIDLNRITVPTIVISDWQLSLDAATPSTWKKIKLASSIPPTFCLMVTSHEEDTDYARALAEGVDDILLEPIDPAELKARILAGKRFLKLKQELQAQQQLLEAELSEAEAYVRSLLPGDACEKIPIKARFVPSRLLGGDCYDYYWLDPDYLAIYLLDVSGHGLGSALLSTSVLNVLRSQSLPDVNFYRPEKVLTALNETFQMNDQNEKYFTIWYGVYNRANRQLLYSSAGHPPAVLVSNYKEDFQTTECLKTSGLPIGMLPDVKYRWQRCYIPPSSRLYVFSDGIYEIQQADNTLMGLDGFITILSEHMPDDTIDGILNKVSARTQGKAFSDDLSLLEICLE